MTFRSIAPLCFVGILSLAGCASVSSREVAEARARGVPAAVVRKLAEKRVITPPEIISLARHGVPDAVIEDHLHSVGVNYVVSPSDVAHMHRGGVSAHVIETVLVECDRFARHRTGVPLDGAYGLWWTASPESERDL